jgi:tol-pal system protein YbgF
MIDRVYSWFALILVGGILVSITNPSHAQNSDSKLGIGANIGLQKPFCDIQHTGAGLTGSALMRFIMSDKFDFAITVGYGELNDGFDYNSFETSTINADLKINYHLKKTGRFDPYLSLGIGMVNFEYNPTKPWALGDPTLSGERQTHALAMYGGGFELFLSPKFALNVFADYRFASGDLLDGFESGRYEDGYLNTKLGFTFYMGRGRSRALQQPSDDLLALEPVEIDDQQKRYEFEEKLDQLEQEEKDRSMEQYVRLKSRVDELSQLINEKENEIDELQATLSSKSQRISQLENTLTGYSPISESRGRDGSFSATYEMALGNFYRRDYRQAITVFDQLKEQYSHHKLASNCQYWIGECQFGLANYQQAADAFHKVFNYSFSYKKDDATLMLGRCYLKLNDPARARSYFQGVIDDYPGSEYVEKAREWLNRM